MKAHFQYIVTFLLVAVLFSCKKEPIEEPVPDEQPIFYANCLLNGESINITAGQSNFYMHSFSELRNGVKYFTGNLGNSGVSLEMGIYDGNIDRMYELFYTSLPDSLDFALINQTSVSFSKDSLPNSQFIDEIQWYIDGVYAGLNDIHINQPGKYAVCATVSFFDGSQKNVCNDVIVGYARHASGALRHFMSQDGVLQCWVDEYSVGISNISWFIDGDFVSNEDKMVLNVDEQIHTVMADVVFQNGTHRKKTILVDGSLSGRFLDDFTVMEEQSTMYNQDFNVFIGFKKDGKEYRSDLTENQYSKVKINEISYFGLNSAGNPVFKVLAEIDCNLKEVNSGNVVPLSCTTTFGIEVK